MEGQETTYSFTLSVLLHTALCLCVTGCLTWLETILQVGSEMRTSDMVWASYSSSSTCIAFVAALLGLLLFAVLCHLLLWWHKTTLGWFYHPEGGGFNKEGGFLPPKGWFYPLKSGHKTTRGGFKVGFMPHLGVVLCLGPRKMQL